MVPEEAPGRTVDVVLHALRPGHGLDHTPALPLQAVHGGPHGSAAGVLVVQEDRQWPVVVSRLQVFLQPNPQVGKSVVILKPDVGKSGAVVENWKQGDVNESGDPLCET